MSRVLLKEEQPTCPIIGVVGLIKLHSFEKELQAFGENRVVDLMRIASEIPLNLMYIAINGKIYKYNMVTKQSLVEF